ncbi:hypothetical protein GOZ84_20435 [Agrobacterium vitis]|uniref:hypothetical protein n=1 Tax=Agrobacterium vitis TaxID=373 RepID=UPI0012E761AF|nr:hypothetical protein [Agrobacterium vitis]MVA53132.1 hypothetical protein [Agrobacterium vitis]
MHLTNHQVEIYKHIACPAQGCVGDSQQELLPAMTTKSMGLITNYGVTRMLIFSQQGGSYFYGTPHSMAFDQIHLFLQFFKMQ